MGFVCTCVLAGAFGCLCVLPFVCTLLCMLACIFVCVYPYREEKGEIKERERENYNIQT